MALVFGLQILLSGLLLAYVYAATTRAVAQQQRGIVAELRNDLLAGFQSGGERGLSQLIAARLDATDAHDIVALLVHADRRVIAGNLAAWPGNVANDDHWHTLTLMRTGGDRPERMEVIATALPQGAHLLTGRVLEENLRLTSINAEAIVAALLIALPLALLMAVLLGRIINTRLRSVTTTAAAVASGDLSQRVPRDGSNDAFDALAAAVNTMLARVEALVGELRIVTDGLAHDLRSPLTRLKSTLERARDETADSGAMAALDSVATEADQVLAMLGMALQISRAEAGIGRDRFVATDVDALIGDLIEVFGPVAEDAGITLRRGGERVGTITLHRELVQQALVNLVENALHYAEGATRITVSAARSNNRLSLTVADDGPGIAADRREEAKRRFSRLDPSRHSAGSGLGLALVEAVARLHGGSLALWDNGPGLRAVMMLAE